ncbi:hypothetical protein D8674_035217 [Pyrus ussuriensis x Pyrus communis]|uniref:Poly(A) polymerase nucleotidyltransferase domain-containing protein n=1 Tax=Pyrus ussuriensis x Pyrus communis TaxID=2448454 RepID=A0A5N5GGD1_9ROSA|nr:hypothetical protein D8674_035217 [Pyrus ussuriensis x Pyrus communis]
MKPYGTLISVFGKLCYLATQYDYPHWPSKSVKPAFEPYDPRYGFRKSLPPIPSSMKVGMYVGYTVDRSNILVSLTAKKKRFKFCAFQVTRRKRNSVKADKCGSFPFRGEAMIAEVNIVFIVNLCESPHSELLIVMDWMKQVTRSRGYTDQMAADANALLFTFGSYTLGVHGPGDDIDTLCVEPSYVNREEDFFYILQNILDEMEEVTELQSLPDAHVPIEHDTLGMLQCHPYPHEYVETTKQCAHSAFFYRFAKEARGQNSRP